MNILELIKEMQRYTQAGEKDSLLFIHENNPIRSTTGNGVNIISREHREGVDVRIYVTRDVNKPIHLCFAILKKMGEQNIQVNIMVEDGAHVEFISHCVFPNAENVIHNSRVNFKIGHGAYVRYKETHVHSPDGKININSEVKVKVGIKSKFDLEFIATHGRAGKINSTTEIEVGSESTSNVLVKIFGKMDDEISLNEKIVLEGCESRGVVKTRIVAKNEARSVVNSEIVGKGIESRGHIDCTEILMDNATARAYPIVDVREPTSKLTHEAAIGRVDKKQIITLLCRGMNEEEATDFIVQGLLR